MSVRGNNANMSLGQNAFGVQSQYSSTPGVSTSHFSRSSTSTVPAQGFSDMGHNTHPPSQQHQHTYASFPLPHPPQISYQHQFHPLAPPQGSIPASGPLQPLPREAQPGWTDANVGSNGTSTVNIPESTHRNGGEGRRSESPRGTRSTATDEDDDDGRTDQGGPSDSVGSGDISEESESAMRMDIDDALRGDGDDDQSDNDTERNEGRPTSSSGSRFILGRGRSGSTRESVTKDRDGEERRKGKDSPKLRSKPSSTSISNPTPSSIRREQKRARTESYSQPQYHQPIAPAPWAPAPHPPLSAASSASNSASAASNPTAASNPSVMGSSGVPAPIIDPSLNGASIGGLPPGVRIPPPPGAIIAPGAPNNTIGVSRSGTATPTVPDSSGPTIGRIPPPPGATVDSSTTITTNGNSAPSSGIAGAIVDASISDTSVQGSGSPGGGPNVSSSGSQHQHVPYEQPYAHQPPIPGPPVYGVQAQLTSLPPRHPGNPAQYPHPSQQQTTHHPLPPPPHSHSHPGPTPYGAFRQPPMPTHAQYSYSAPPHASYNPGPPPPPTMPPPTPQGYAGYPAWGVSSTQHQQLVSQEQYQQPMTMQQLQYQQPGYGYPPPPPAQVRPYEYGQPLQPQPQAQHIYPPYAPAPYGYYDPAQQQPGAPVQQNPFQAGNYGGTVGTPSPGAIGAAPIVGAPPLLGPGQPGQQSTTPPNGTTGGGYVDYGSSSYPSQPPPGPPRPGSPRAFQPPQSQQYGYPSQLPPPPPHHPQYSQHSQHHLGPPAPYPPPYGYMAYGNGNGNGNGGNGSLPNTPGVVGFSGNNGAVGPDMWGAGTAPSTGTPASWDTAPLPSAYTGTTTAPSATYSNVGVQLGNSGDRIQLAPMRQPSSGNDASGMYPNIIQLRSSSRSSRDEGKERSASGVANISTTGRERDRDRGRDRERDVGYSGRDRERERDDRMSHLDRDKERLGDSRDRDRDERGTKKNPLAIGNIIESGP
ncbi:hypothetical protein GGU11DRAFT_582508 [Lentinula aff. detonsa]|nr:hypothetical protein GGU11DRAFT_582508 [Lentinula aff. detonsa]